MSEIAQTNYYDNYNNKLSPTNCSFIAIYRQKQLGNVFLCQTAYIPRILGPGSWSKLRSFEAAKVVGLREGAGTVVNWPFLLLQNFSALTFVLRNYYNIN